MVLYEGGNMKKVIKYLWCCINLLAILAFVGIYLYYTYPLFLPPYEWVNLIFILLFLIFIEGFLESFISCFAADESSWHCWVSLIGLTVAIAVLFCTSYFLIADLKQVLDAGAQGRDPVIAVIMALIAILGPVLLSPMLISKYSSWVLLVISLFGEHESKVEIIFPIVSIIINIAASIVLSQVELTQGWLIAYVCVFGALSIASFIFTIKNN